MHPRSTNGCGEGNRRVAYTILSVSWEELVNLPCTGANQPHWISVSVDIECARSKQIRWLPNKPLPTTHVVNTESIRSIVASGRNGKNVYVKLSATVETGPRAVSCGLIDCSKYILDRSPDVLIVGEVPQNHTIVGSQPNHTNG